MSRRPTHAAGYSWRKWEDPIVYRHRSFLRDVLFLVVCIEAGTVAALAMFWVPS